ATVDKFAQMPWRGATQALFGETRRRCERHGFLTPDEDDHPSSHRAEGTLPAAKVNDVVAPRPPDLIIQDELHLISGPLGSLVGLYEGAVDRLSTWVVNGQPVRPKVVASTATIRRAELQVDKLFARQVRIFPPPGLDARDSFFALQRDQPGDTEERPGRRYVGVCAPGRRLKQVLIRVYVAQMAAAQALIEKYGDDADAYMTLVGYFNSLRELGGMRRLVEDDVTTRLGKMPEHGLPRRSRPILEELTSRKNAGDIPRVLDRLGTAHVWPRPEKRDGPLPIDVLLATNMISVGVDVPRLGAMVCAGQPKAASEYIQATSRVGRSDPGLVLTVYNWARPRDLSHYETFEHFHATFYRHVEALSVTPFSPRALDRGLTGVLAALVRLGGPEWNANRGAEDVDGHAARLVAEIDALCDRAANREGRQEVADEVRSQLVTRLERWTEQQHVEGRKLGYKPGGKGTVYGLLREPGRERWNTWTVPTSLREVEAPVTLVLREPLGGAPTTPYRFPAKKTNDAADAAEEPAS
ncbi:MAG TPA: helicase-related protein, partial [Baekduia sp.]|nr:helicase-related protein [Baekduia sp.]